MTTSCWFQAYSGVIQSSVCLYLLRLTLRVGVTGYGAGQGLHSCSYFIVTDAAHGDVRSEAGRPRDPEEGHAQVLVLVRRVLLKSCRTRGRSGIGFIYTISKPNHFNAWSGLTTQSTSQGPVCLKLRFLSRVLRRLGHWNVHLDWWRSKLHCIAWTGYAPWLATGDITTQPLRPSSALTASRLTFNTQRSWAVDGGATVVPSEPETKSVQLNM